MKYPGALWAILLWLMPASSGPAMNKAVYPVAEMKGCLLEDLFYAKTHVDDPSLRETRAELKAGGVAILVTPVFAVDQSPADDLVKQSEIFRNLPTNYPGDFYIIETIEDLKNLKPGKTGLIGAIENAGAMFSGSTKFDEGVDVFEKIIQNTGQILYVGMTWKYENILGGGDTTTVGLKDCGKRLLKYLSERNKKNSYKIAIDVSHASDALAKDIFDYIEKNSLGLRIVASHSSVRHIRNIPRNVPDWVIRGIIDSGGVVGLNFINGYIGDDSTDFLRHFEYIFKNLNGEKNTVFGADWFKTDRSDVSAVVNQVHAYFFNRYGNASTYHVLLDDLMEKYKFTDDQLQDIASRNLVKFILKQWGNEDSK